MPNNDEPDVQLIITLLQSPIAFHRAFALIGKSANAGLFLSQAWYWTQRTKNREGWFYKTEAEWEEETTLTRYEQATARKHLRKAGFLEEKRQGVPARLWYRLDLKMIVKAVSQLRKSSKLDSGKAANKNAAKQDTRMPLFSNYKGTETTAETAAKTRGSSMPPPPSRFDYATRLAFVTATKSNKTNPAGLAHHLANGEDDAQIDAWLAANAKTEQQRAKAAAAMINERSSEDLQQLIEETRQRVESGTAFDWERELLNSHTERNPA